MNLYKDKSTYRRVVGLSFILLALFALGVWAIALSSLASGEVITGKRGRVADPTTLWICASAFLALGAIPPISRIWRKGENHNGLPNSLLVLGALTFLALGVGAGVAAYAQEVALAGNEP